MGLSALDRWARRNHGLVAREAVGMPASKWYRWIRAGALIQVHPGVARLPGAATTPEQAIAAAVLALGDRALASHRSSSRLWGIPRPEHDPIDVILGGRSPFRRLGGVEIHRPRDQQRLLAQRRDNIRCTNILRTLVDLGAVEPAAVPDAIGHAVVNRLASVSALEAAVVQHSERGRTGVPVLRDALAEWRIDGKPSDAALEAAFERLVDRHGLPDVEFHAMIEGREVDFRVIGSPVVLECDGWMYHGLDRAGFERDRVRDAELVAAGWIVVRFTYRAVTRTPDSVVSRVRATVERWRDRPAPDAA